MKHYKKQTRYVSVVTVQVHVTFSAIEMMRYDRCCPATEDDSRKIARLGEFRPDAKPEDFIIRFHRFSVNPDHVTVGRWESFGCRVLDERSPEDVPLSDEAAVRLAAR